MKGGFGYGGQGWNRYALGNNTTPQSSGTQ
ncbi:protein of unknown function [Candidatus Nitrosotalea okcheonensis]|uniref:Uncharacterized protein n=1 Tax=Candidatus Nitrosotalea okcheonensis TaxID=1903276 RepID=A0A2H1FC79_9ARCH|nr:protein of unknown function [Candidatus Nitrosotalea okcheonensis]